MPATDVGHRLERLKTVRRTALVVAIAIVAIAGAAAYHVSGAFFSRRVAVGVENARVVSGLRANRALIVVIDGLRRDMALDSGHLAIARELAARGASGPAFAEDPTMTGAGVRVLATSTPPAFSDIVENKRIAAVTHQSLISSLAAAGHVVAAVGDHTWTDGFGASIAIDRTKSQVPPVLAIMDPAYRQDHAFLLAAKQVLSLTPATVTIVHLFGADAISHGAGPHSKAYAKKLRRLDGELRELIAACGDDCLVVLTSDHGASDEGHHGLGEPIARETPLILAGPGVKRGVTFTARQLDVAPTLAVLLGAAIPSAARGRVLVEALEIDERTRAAIAIANAERLADYAAAHDREFATALPRVDVAALRAAMPDVVATRAADAAARAANEAMRVGASSGTGSAIVAARRVNDAPSGAAPDAESAALAEVARRADAASARVIEALRADDVWRTRRLLLWVVAFVGLAVLVVAGFVPRGTPASRRAIVIASASTVVVAIGFAIWRTNAALWQREIASRDTLHGIPTWIIASLAIAIAIVLAGQPWRSSRTDLFSRAGRIGPVAPWSRWLALLWLVPIAAPSERLLLWACFGVLAALAGRAAPLLLTAAVSWQFAPDAALYVGGGAIAIALAYRQLDGSWRSVAIAMLASGVLVRVVGSPPLVARGYLVALAIALVAAAVLRSRAALGWIAAAGLLVLSRGFEVLPIAGVVAAVALARIDSPLRFAAIVVAGRLAIFSILEVRFSYSRVEWHAGDFGNPDADLLLNHVIVGGKLALAMLALVGIAGGKLVAATGSSSALRAGLAWIAAYIAMHLAWAISSLVMTAGQYHTPYVDLSEVMFFAAFAGSLAIAWLVEAVSARDRSTCRANRISAISRREVSEIVRPSDT